MTLLSNACELDKIYIHNGLNFVVEVEQFGGILFVLSGSVYSGFSFHRIELSLDRSIQEEISLAFLLILDGSVP